MEERPITEISEKKKTGFKEKCENAYAFIRGLPTIGINAVAKEGRAKIKSPILAFLCYGFVSLALVRGEIFFGATPFMLAFVMQAEGVKAVFAFAGGLLGAVFLSDEPFAKTVCLLLGMGARVLLRYAPGSRGFLKEPLTIRCTLSFASGFIFSFFKVIASGFSSESIYAMLITSAVAPIASAVFSYSENSNSHELYRDIGLCFTLFFTIYSLGRAPLFGLSLGFLVSVLITFCMAARSGALRAVVTGCLCGLALGAEYAPVIASAGLVAGFFMGANPVWSVFAASIVSSILAVYISGYTSLIGYAGDALFASVIFIVLNKANMIPTLKFFESVEMKGSGRESTKEGKRLVALSSALEGLSGELMNISEKQREPSLKEYRELCEDVFSERCSGCKNSSLCLGILYQDTAETVNCAAKELSERKIVSSGALGESFAERCPYSEEIVLDINSKAASFFEERHKRDKTEIIALDYEAISELLCFAIDKDEDESTEDHALAFAASRALRSLGISAVGYNAYGKRIKTVTVNGISVGSLTASASEIRQALEKECKTVFKEPSFDFVSDKIVMKITSDEKISVDTGGASCAKAGENECGDRIKSFAAENGINACIICDGMGSGAGAARTAEISSVFLEKMINAGNKKDTVLKMLSNFIRSRSEECASSVDIAEIDRYTSEVRFTKCGAAPSLIIRKGKLFRIESHSLPIGVTRDIDPEETSVLLCENDIIIMMSDGVYDSVGVSKIAECVESNRTENAKHIAEAVLRLSDISGAEDDRSVIVAKILRSA